jgi:hypothetical protein
MGLVLLYLVIFAGALLASVCLWLGLEPPAAQWDSLAFTWLIAWSYIVQLGAMVGLLVEIRIPRLPRRANNFLHGVFMMVLGFLMLSSMEVSDASTWPEIGQDLGRFAGFGVLAGVVVGGLGSLDSGSKAEPAEARSPRARRIYALVLTVIAVAGPTFLLVPRPKADSALENVATFGDPQTRLVLLTKQPFLEKHPVIGIQNGGHFNTIVFDQEDWPRFVALWTAAKAAQGGAWRELGEVDDEIPGEDDRLSLAAGPGVRFVLRARHGPPLVYLLQPSDIPSFDRGVARMGAELGG